MPINFPTDRKEVANRMKTDVKNTLRGSNPFLRNSWLGALIIAVAGRVYDFYYQLLNNLVKELFPDTATTTFLERWGRWVGVLRNVATQATGTLVVTGSLGAVVPAASEWLNSDGAIITTDEEVTIAEVSASLTSITRSGTLATATTSAAHSFATGQNVTISGADQADYNGTFQIVAVSTTTFTFTVENSPTTPATGTIVATANMAAVAVTTETYGQAANQDSGDALTASSTIAGIDSTAYVGLDGLSGGEDAEGDDAYRVRTKERYSNPTTLFNAAAIIVAAKSVTGVTRVWVEACTPETGEVTVYFVCDNDDPITPDADKIAAVKAAIMAIAPATVSETYVHVEAPTLDAHAFTFTFLSPDTSTMRAAITANLKQAFLENGKEGVNFSKYAYTSAIYNTVDLDTGASVTNFTLSTPTSDLNVSAGHIPVVGTITFPA